MRPLSLSARGYRSFASLEFVFPDGATAIVGPNGSGKSSLMGAVELALFGPRGRSLEPYVTEGADDLQVELAFEHAGCRYRVRRGWKAGRSTLDFERAGFDEADIRAGIAIAKVGIDPGDFHEQWMPLTQGNAADTQALLERTIGLTRATFLASAYLAQRESDSFTAAQPRDRKRLLSDALALDDWPRAADAVAADRRAAEKEDAELSARIVVFADQAARAVELEAEAERLAGEMTSAAELAEQTEAEHVSAADALRAAEQAESEWQTRAQALEVAAAKVAPLRDTAGQAHLARDRAESVRFDIIRLEALAVEHDAAQAERARLAEQDRARVEAVAERDRLLGQAAALMDEAERMLADESSWAERVRELHGKIDALAQEAPTCDRCGQEVHGEARAKAAASLAADRDAAVAKLTAIGVDREDIADRAIALDKQQAAVVIPEPVLGLAAMDARIAETRGAAADLAAARERHASITTLIERATEPAFTQALEAAEHDHQVAAQQAAAAVRPEGVDLLRATCVSAKAAADVARQRHTNAQVEHARVVAQADQLEASAAEHETLLARREQLRADLDVLAGLEQAFGRDGVPAWIVEQQALPAIELEANRVLARLGGAVSRVEFRTERETKTGERREALDIVCVTDEGERSLETFSGGEQARAEIACALGLVSLLGSRRGADLRYLALDEPPGLDRQGTEALAEILREIAAGAGVDVVLLASHDPGLRDQFDQAVTVTKVGGRSQVAA